MSIVRRLKAARCTMHRQLSIGPTRTITTNTMAISRRAICSNRECVALMYTNILIPTDGSELAEKAVRHGFALAKSIGARTTALTVLPPFHTFTIDTQMIEDT